MRTIVTIKREPADDDNRIIIDRVAEHFARMQRRYLELVPKVASFERYLDGGMREVPAYEIAYDIIPVITRLASFDRQADVMKQELLDLPEELRKEILSDLRFWQDGITGALARMTEVYVLALGLNSEKAAI